MLLDTCSLLWFLRNDEELSESAAVAIEDPANEVFVSVVSIWEIAIKAGLGKIRVPNDFETGLEQKLTQDGFTLLHVNYRHAAGVFTLPPVHADPFDRLLISQCRAEKLVAVTNDSHWSAAPYGLRVLW
ncbi:MAG: type II toxin-antitoxin system VapC family toxin [Verrucomicrobia bacterium]|nr:type II toxin-antitoxin system VapC family toxin [Verrucomicrobiota bacterium]